MSGNGPVIRVPKWGEFQHYKDRSPPWVKLHRSLLTNRQWHELSGGASKLLAECWLLASESEDGTIPISTADLAWRTRRERDETRRFLQELERQGFLDLSRHDASTALAERSQVATPEGETEAEAEREGETEPSPNGDSPKSDEPLSDLWGVWIEELGGDPPHPRWTDKRRQKLRAFYREHLSDESDPMEQFRRVLRTVQQSDHHMSTRSYQMPESLFRSEERRDRWMKLAMGNTGPNGSGGWEDDL